MKSSNNCSSWTEIFFQTDYNLYSICFGNDIFIVVGNDKTLKSINNGDTWIELSTEQPNVWIDITYGNGRFVAVGGNDASMISNVMTSVNDGASWTYFVNNQHMIYSSIKYSNNLSKFVAVSYFGDDYRSMSSSDGIAWVSHECPNYEWASITFGNGKFVAISYDGYVMTSVDGDTWISQSKPFLNNVLTSITYGNGLFVAVGYNNYVMTSPNGTIWTQYNTNTTKEWNDVTYGNGLFVAVSNNGHPNQVMTGIDNSCFLKGSLILTSSDEYVSIENLKQGDLIKTYKNGDKKIHGVGSRSYPNISTNKLFCMYTDEEHNLTISGGHSVLVDKLTEEQEKNQNSIPFESKIEDKYLLLTCFNDKFKKIEINHEVFEIYHLCLENEDLTGQFGIWANNVLTETCSINVFNRMNFTPN